MKREQDFVTKWAGPSEHRGRKVRSLEVCERTQQVRGRELAAVGLVSGAWGCEGEQER